MNAAFALVLWNALNAVAATLAIKAACALTGENQGEKLMSVARVRIYRRASFSILAGREPDVCLGKLGDEALGVETAFACADLHGALFCHRLGAFRS